MSANLFCDNLEGWDRVGGVKGVQEGGKSVHLCLIHVDIRQKWAQYCEAIILQLKINAFKKNSNLKI